MPIRTVDELRRLYAPALERSVRKEIAALDRHCRDYIAMSPFVVISTADAALNLDASPRGGDPGFVRVVDANTLLLPDWPGNNRLDSLQNIVATGRIGLLFLIPGFDETLRVNGDALLSTDEADLAACANARRTPKLVIRVAVTAAYLHCPKAFLRAKLWDPASRMERDRLPTMGQMIADQSGMVIAPETREEMLRRVAPDL